MTQFSLAELFGMTIRESATDGSDFTNPSADYRRLFLGEDGQLHVKDSAGAVTDIGSGSGISGIPTVQAKRTSGNFTLNNTSWTNLDTGIDLTIAAATGDVLEFSASMNWGNEATNGILDVATIVGGSPVNYVATAGGASAFGVPAWIGNASVNAARGGSILYTVVSGDISGGNVLCRLRFRTSTAVNKNLNSTTDVPFFWSVKNLLQ